MITYAWLFFPDIYFPGNLGTTTTHLTCGPAGYIGLLNWSDRVHYIDHMHVVRKLLLIWFHIKQDRRRAVVLVSYWNFGFLRSMGYSPKPTHFQAFKDEHTPCPRKLKHPLIPITFLSLVPCFTLLVWRVVPWAGENLLTCLWSNGGK